MALGLALAAAVAAGFWVLGGEDEGDQPAIPDITARAGSTSVPGTGMLVPDRPEPGKLAPDFALVDARDTTQVRKLSDYFGTPIVLNWYATWCDPCRDEIPAFVDVQEQVGNAVQFIGVNRDQSAGEAVGMLDEYGATYPALLDTRARVADHYRNPGMPTTYFIAADGTLVAAHAGGLTVEQLAENLAEIGVSYSPPEGD